MFEYGFVMLLLSDKELIQFYKDKEEPLPFPLSSLRKDRYNGALGGIPFRKIGTAVVYAPDDIEEWKSKLPVYRGGNKNSPVETKSGRIRMGRPSREESRRAADLGITVHELRAKDMETGHSKKH